MKLLSTLMRRFGARLPLALCLGAVGAVAGLAVIALVNRLIAGTLAANAATFAGLGLALVLVFGCGFASQSVLTALGHRVVRDMRTTTVKRLLDTDIDRLEGIGAPALYATLTKDITAVGQAFNRLPFIFYNGILLGGGFAYLAWLSWQLFLMSAVVLGLAVACAQGWVFAMRRLMMEVRATDDRLFAGYRGAIEGRAELALNAARRAVFHRLDVEAAAEHARATETHADRYWVLSLSWTSLVILGLIVGLFIVGTHLGLAREQVAGFVLVLLFLRMPLNDLVGTLPILMAGGVALAKVESLNLAPYRAGFDVPGGLILVTAAPAGATAVPPPLFDLSGVTYDHPGQDGEAGFHLGPVDLSVPVGETLFIVGGNGGGKSTLLALLAGLRRPVGGHLRLGGVEVTDDLRGWHREQISAVLSPAYVFEHLVGPDGRLDQDLAQDFLRRLRMDHKVTIAEDRFSDTRFSQGQRKRLALLSAVVERRPILLLDEWAADQDPAFRRYFYEELLPELKRGGRTIIAVSHDDRFFHLADRVLRCDAGVLTPWQVPPADAGPAHSLGPTFNDGAPRASAPPGGRQQ
ncbi:cyclic peptide export ABC transporter [Nitrospirillum viridazoti]|uniref:ABC transporter ATP-binding protein n=1 Tax=Nitrospirillum viridazoti CBAmc TaxID=1441467 RepID=A0A248K0V7_9PROT|nr:cyclic peptide export ABC transporter [Nitrospirillum amazonense]ASG24396.1 ABC transporter ATP-binding protein [Nitrospirillum amazonense CBAmc]TWB33353.1 putative ATP-binding cassette transporter [Nitrospirillum amazonense]